MAKQRVVTGVGRFVFVNLVTPRVSDLSEDKTPKYSTGFLVPKTDTQTHQALSAAVQAEVQAGGLNPARFRHPAVADGDQRADAKAQESGEDSYAFMRGFWLINPRSKFAPGLVGSDGQRLLIADPTESPFYSGCWGRVSVGTYHYNRAGNSGVSFNLFNAQFTQGGEEIRLGPAPEDDFAPSAVATQVWQQPAPQPAPVAQPGAYPPPPQGYPYGQQPAPQPPAQPYGQPAQPAAPGQPNWL